MSEERAMEILRQRGMSEAEARDFIAGCKKGLKDCHEGKVTLWDRVKKELGIDEPKTSEGKAAASLCSMISTIMPKEKQ